MVGYNEINHLYIRKLTNMTYNIHTYVNGSIRIICKWITQLVAKPKFYPSGMLCHTFNLDPSQTLNMMPRFNINLRYLLFC